MISTEKARVRVTATKLRDTAFRNAVDTVPQANARLAALLADHAGTLAGYLPIRSELSPIETMRTWHDGADVAVPVVEKPNHPLQFAKWSPDCQLQKGAFGVEIPDPIIPVSPQILIVPLLAFDRTGYRLGYGGGFYDRTIAAIPGAITIGFAFAAQEMPKVPRETTDQKLDFIVTEAETLYCS